MFIWVFFEPNDFDKKTTFQRSFEFLQNNFLTSRLFLSRKLLNNIRKKVNKKKQNHAIKAKLNVSFINLKSKSKSNHNHDHNNELAFSVIDKLYIYNI